ncbi:MAG: discoidin domain-containing protein [Armatimonadetes bacterium]|nr:discoidin domain-containing protein [Armatimonadota bacterium]
MRLSWAALAVCVPVFAAPTPPDKLTGPQPWLESSQQPAGDRVGQCAFDGDDTTSYKSAGPAKSGDTLTVELSEPVAVKELAVLTGEADGSAKLAAGALEVSVDGKAWEDVAKVDAGTAKTKLDGRQVKALRLKVTADGTDPLVVRELWLSSTPAVPRYSYPLDLLVDCQAADLKDWSVGMRRTVMTWWPFFCEMLASDGYRPARRIDMDIKEQDGVAATGGTHITGSAQWFRAHRDDVGAMIHESIHVIQHYPRYDPVWLVEGITDWARWWNYETLGHRPKPRPGGSYRDSYQRTGAFLDWIETHRAPGLTVKLSTAMRRNQYSPDVWARWTGADLDTLWAEYQASFAK